MNKAKLNIRNTTFLFSSCIGAGISVGLSLLVMVLNSICISNEYIELSVGTFMVIIGQFISVFAGAMIAGKATKGENKQLSCCCVALIYYLMFTCVGMLVFDVHITFIIRGIISCAGGCIAAILFCCRTKKWISGKRKRRRSR